MQIVTVIGAGYVGLSTAVAFAMAGHQIHLYEQNPERVNSLSVGKIPFQEPLLETVFGQLKDQICIATELGAAIRASSVIVLAVGTPSTPAQGVDLSQVFNAVEMLAPFLDNTPSLIVMKSTVPVGTNQEIQKIITERNPKAVFAIASNPEFLRQGRALRDALFPDRIVLGTNQPWALDRLRTLYAPIEHATFAVPPELEPYRPKQPIPVLEVSTASAELAKYAANAFLAMKISFINEIANVCDSTTADIDQIVSVLELDTRIGKDFLRPGLGYGGSCFPKDTRALSQLSSRSGYEFRLLRAVIEVNNEQRYRALDKLERALQGYRGKKIAVLGLSFKPDTDDLRESIGLDMVAELLARGAKVVAHDPIIQKPPQLHIEALLEDALFEAEAAILVTEWQDYLDANWNDLGQLMKQKIILDGRNALNAKTMKLFGFTYFSMGRH